MRRIERRNVNDSILPILVFFGLFFFGLQAIVSNIEKFPQILVLILLFFCLSLFASISALSFFILPLKIPADFFKLLQRIILFALHLHGPIQFVRDGKPEIIHAGFKPNHPGLIWLDSDSAAIISQTTSYHRIAGPGICFTERDEFIIKSISLLPQKKWVGPFEDEKPFAPQGKKEPIDDYQARIKRAEKTTAFTIDGKKIIASFLLEFKLDAAAGEGACPYGFNPISIKKALLSHPIAARNGMAVFMEEWSDLPGILIANFWKEYISFIKSEEIISEEKDILAEFLREIQNSIEEKNITSIRPSAQFEAIRQLKDLRGIALREVHLMHVFLEEENQVTQYKDIQEPSSTELNTIPRITESEKTTMNARSQQILGSILAGVINELSIKRGFSYETLRKSIYQHLKTIPKRF